MVRGVFQHNRPQMVFHLGFAQHLVTDQKSDIRVICCGAERSLPKLRRLCDLKAEAVGGCEFRRFVTHYGQSLALAEEFHLAAP